MTVICLIISVVVYFATAFVLALTGYGRDCLPVWLKGQKHIDRIPGLSWMSRNSTARALVEPPFMIMGSKGQLLGCGKNGKPGPKPIPKAGQWQLCAVQVEEGSWFFLPYFAITTRFVHFRIGTRWDDVDNYYTLDSVALKVKDFRKSTQNKEAF